MSGAENHLLPGTGLPPPGGSETETISLSLNTFLNTAGLLNRVADLRSIAANQDQTLANEVERCSRYSVPAGMKYSDCICLPPDILVYNTVGSTGLPVTTLTCSELNGTGFGGMHALPADQFNTVMTSFRQAARQLTQTCSVSPLIIIASSGRELAVRHEGKYAVEDNNPLIYEKVLIADCYAIEAGGEVISLDDLCHEYLKEKDRLYSLLKGGKLTPAEFNNNCLSAYQQASLNMSLLSDKTLIVLGYTRDIVDCCRVINGQPHLFGRPVNGFMNDRAAYNLSRDKQCALDLSTFHMMNICYKEGADKYAAACAMSLFQQSPEAQDLPRLALTRGFQFHLAGLDKVSPLHCKTSDTDDPQIKYFTGITEQEGIDGVMAALTAFTRHGLIPLFKPSGTGQGQGIIAYQQGESADHFRKRFTENLSHIHAVYANGAGWPFLAEPVLQLAKDDEDRLFDLRFVIYLKTDAAGNNYFHSVPLVIKKSADPHQQYSPADGPVFEPTNVTFSVKKTDKDYSTFLVPLCTDDAIRKAGLHLDVIKSIGLYLSAFQSWLIKTHYSQGH